MPTEIRLAHYPRFDLPSLPCYKCPFCVPGLAGHTSARLGESGADSEAAKLSIPVLVL